MGRALTTVAAVAERRRGYAYGVTAYLLWGLFPLYWPLLEPAGAIEILAHRIVWSLVVIGVLLGTRGGLVRLRTVDGRARRLLVVAALVITVNWGTYIYGVNSGQVVETSLGYFVNPLVTVLLGVVVLGERLRRMQWVAVGIAGLAVAVLTVDYDRVPWIALVLACSFGTYGLLKRQAGVGAVESLAVETAVLALPAAAVLVVLQVQGVGQLGQTSIGGTALLVGAGIVTVVPLLAFSGAATRIPLTALGILQYLAPTVQFLLGVLVLGEPMPLTRLAGFALVWLALAVFTADALTRRRRGDAELTPSDPPPPGTGP